VVALFEFPQFLLQLGIQKLPAFTPSVENREECIGRGSTEFGFQIFSSQLLPQDLESIQIRISKINGSPFIAVGIQVRPLSSLM